MVVEGISVRHKEVTNMSWQQAETATGWRNEAVESYRRTLIFNNTLLIKEFSERYDFRVSEKVRKMRSQGIPENRVIAYEARAMKAKEQKGDLYSKRLEANVEPTVRRYIGNLRAFIMGTEPE